MGGPRSRDRGWGVARGRVVPSPSWPASLAPQQRTPPFARPAQVWSPPSATTVALVIQGTEAGVLRLVLRLSPSWPLVPAPQQRTVPSTSTAQLCARPVATPRTPPAIPVTASGLGLGVFVPSPSSPSALEPQQTGVPSLRRAQECVAPSASCATVPAPSPTTGLSGESTKLSDVPRPSWPSPSSPQQ